MNMENTYKNFAEVDFSKINITEDVDLMARGIVTQHIKFQESRLIVILKEVLTKTEFERVQTLLKANNKSVLGVFLKDRNIEITMDRQNISTSFVILNLYVKFYSGTESEFIIPIYGSEERFKKSLKAINENYGKKSNGIQ